jgi:hypothetical protein
MAGFEDELLDDAQHDANAVAYMYAHLPQEMQEKFSEENLYYCLDLIETYLTEKVDFTQEEVELDLEVITQYILQVAKKDGYDALDEEGVYLAVNAYFDFEEENGNL